MKMSSAFWGCFKVRYFGHGLLLCMLMAACGGPSPKRVEDANLKYQLGQKLHARGQVIEAIASVQESLRVNKKNAEVHNFLGLLYFERKMYEDARKSFLAAIKLNPKYSEAHNHVCVTYTELKKYDQAIQHCYKALGNVLYTTPERAYYNLAQIYEKKGDRASAREAHEKAVNFNQRFVLSLNALGNLAYEEGLYPKAIKLFSQAIEACRASPKGTWSDHCSESHYQLALSHLQMRELRQARVAFEACLLDARQDSEFAVKCRQRLALLR